MSPPIFLKMRYMKSVCFLTLVHVFFLWVSYYNTSSRLAFVSGFTPGPARTARLPAPARRATPAAPVSPCVVGEGEGVCQ